MSAPGRAVHGEGRCGLAHCPARVCVCVIRAQDGMTDEGGAPEFVSCPALFAFCEIERGIAGTGLFDDGLKGKGRAGRGGSWRGRCGLAHCPARVFLGMMGRRACGRFAGWGLKRDVRGECLPYWLRRGGARMGDFLDGEWRGSFAMRAGRGGGSWRERCELAPCSAFFFSCGAGRRRADADCAKSGVWRCARRFKALCADLRVRWPVGCVCRKIAPRSC